MPKGFRGIKERLKTRADNFQIERTREASIGLYKVIHDLYRNDKELRDSCMELIRLLQDKNTKEITPEMQTLSDFIIYKTKEDPLKTRKLRRKLNKALMKFAKVAR